MTTVVVLTITMVAVLSLLLRQTAVVTTVVVVAPLTPLWLGLSPQSGHRSAQVQGVPGSACVAAAAAKHRAQGERQCGC